MTPAFILRRHFLGLTALASCSFSSLTAAAAPPSSVQFQALLTSFRQSPGIEAHFEEKKSIALLAVPLTQSGLVLFQAPSSLARIVEKPTPSHVVLRGDRIVARDGSGRRSLDLSDKPALRALVGSLQHLLAGNESQLLDNYGVTMTGQAAQDWTLVLVPLKSELKKMLQSLSLEGNGISISNLKVLEANGDVTSTRFSRVNTQRRFSPDEVKRYFAI